jgi:uncharacterized protein (TIGR00255 family)
MKKEQFPLRSPLRSMTGYAATTLHHNGAAWAVTLRSVNHRYLDLRVHLPEALLPLERKVRSFLQGKDLRGHLDLKIVSEPQSGFGIAINEAVMGNYIQAFQRVASQHGLSSQLDVAALSQLPGVVRSEPESCAELSPALEAAFLEAVQSVVARWDAGRAEEAAILAEDLKARLDAMRKLVEAMERCLQEALPKAQARFSERIEELLRPSGLDPARLAQEAVLLADRTDSSEELLRLKAHLAQFAQVLEADAGAGRKLDFLLQEMNREMNTTLSKVAGLGESGLAATRVGLDLRAEIEKIREQVQNLQ